MPSCITGSIGPVADNYSSGLPDCEDNHSPVSTFVQSSSAHEPVDIACPLNVRKIEAIPAYVPISEVHHEAALLPASAIEKLKLAMDAVLAMYPYYHQIDNIHDAIKRVADEHKMVFDDDNPYLHWQPASELAQHLGEVLGLCTGYSSIGLIYSRQSGVTAFVLVNESLNQVRLLFGGSSSGTSPGDPFARHVKNPAMSFIHWWSNFNNAVLGNIPKSYQDASEILNELISVVKRGEFVDRNMEVVVSGHSKGGGEAAYASLSQKEPVKAVCFSSAEFGAEIQNKIPEEHRNRAKDFVTHYILPDDPAPKMGHVLRRPLALFGNVISIPPIKTGRFVNKSYDQHAYTCKHVVSYACQIGDRSLPSAKEVLLKGLL